MLSTSALYIVNSTANGRSTIKYVKKLAIKALSISQTLTICLPQLSLLLVTLILVENWDSIWYTCFLYLWRIYVSICNYFVSFWANVVTGPYMENFSLFCVKILAWIVRPFADCSEITLNMTFCCTYVFFSGHQAGIICKLK